MTGRAVVLGLIAVFVFCAFGYFNDFVLRQTFLVGNFFPIPVYGGLLVLVLALNPMLRRAGVRWSLRAGEVAVMVGMVLTVCVVPGRGLMHQAPALMIMPRHWERMNVSWKESEPIELIPKEMLVDLEKGRGEALAGYLQGLGEGARHIGLTDIPWGAWKRPIANWFPVMLAFFIMMAGVALVLHRQWSSHEQLPYPIVTFARSLLPGPSGGLAEVFRMPRFWVPAVGVFAMHINNYLFTWFPLNVVQVRTRFSFITLQPLFPSFPRVDGGFLLEPYLFMTTIGFAFFLATDVSLAMALGPLLFAVFTTVAARYGVVVTGPFLQTNIDTFMYAGSYAAMFLVILYTGRHYYGSVASRAVGLRRRLGVEAAAVWGFRVALAGGILFVAQLMRFGLDWILAIPYTVGCVVIGVVLSRIVAEAGAYFVNPWFFPCVLLLGFMGEQAIGTHGLMIMFMVTAMLLIDAREAFMPFFVHAIKLVDTTGVRLGRFASWGVVALALGLATALVATIYWQYDRGIGVASDGWVQREVPEAPGHGVTSVYNKLDGQGLLEESNTVHGLGRLALMAPKKKCVVAFASTFCLVLLFATARLRFPWWPIHPVLFLVLGNWQSNQMAFSFLVGWFVKAMVMKYGGSKVYNRLKPCAIGLIAGEMLAGVATMLAGLVYYLLAEQPPRQFIIFGI